MVRKIDVADITRNIKEMCIEANHFLSGDMAAAMEEAAQVEKAPLGRQILCQLQDNLKIAGEDMIPICQDTGMAVIFLEIGQDVHFVGGLLEHTLSVCKLCGYYVKAYPILNRDLLCAAAICHDIGKVRELSAFPENDYTDDGQLLGHIVIGVEMVSDAVRSIPDFPERLASELKHCIVAHHGELEYGSPKKPALAEALALNFADCADAKMQTLTEIFKDKNSNDWLGYNRLFESNLRKTTMGI